MPRRVLHVRYGGDGPTAWAMLMTAVGIGGALFLTPQPETWTRLSEIRTLLRDRLHLATTVAYGPRYLHSTGQLHKGGPATGVLLQITGDDAEDPAIPGAGYGLATLKAAQALGDLQALSEAGRRIVRLHLKGKQPAGLDKLAQLVRTLVKRA